jgi:hypothetical protein
MTKYTGKVRREIAISACILLLPPVVAIAVLLPHPPRPESGNIPRPFEPVAESPSTSLPITEGRFQLPGTDPTQFEDRFAAAFVRAEEISGQPPPVPEELPVKRPQLSAPNHRMLSTTEARLDHRHLRYRENRDISGRTAHRISRQHHSQRRSLESDLVKLARFDGGRCRLRAGCQARLSETVID